MSHEVAGIAVPAILPDLTGAFAEPNATDNMHTFLRVSEHQWVPSL